MSFNVICITAQLITFLPGSIITLPLFKICPWLTHILLQGQVILVYQNACSYATNSSTLPGDLAEEFQEATGLERYIQNHLMRYCVLYSSTRMAKFMRFCLYSGPGLTARCAGYSCTTSAPRAVRWGTRRDARSELYFPPDILVR